MPVRSYTQLEIRTGRTRVEKPLLTAVLIAQTMFCYADENWVMLAISLVAIGATWLASHRRREIYVRRQVLNLSVVLVGIVLIVRYLVSNQELLIVLGHYVMLIQICKLFERKSDRDYIQMIIMSLLLVLASSMICQELIFALMFLAYIVLLSKAAMALTVRRALNLAERETGPKNPTEPWPARAIVARLAVVVVAILATGAMVFLVVPRSMAGQGGPMSQRRRNGSSSFPDTVRLGQRPKIYLSDRVVMQMRMVDPRSGLSLGAASTTYLRGRSFTRYYDSRWIKDDFGRYLRYANTAPPSLLKHCVAQEISMVPSLLPVAFGTWPTVKMEIDGATVNCLGNLEYAIKLPVKLNRPVRYTAMVLIGPLDAKGQKDLARISARPSRKQLTVSPPNVPPKVADLARQWCADQISSRQSASSGEQLDRIDMEIAETIAARLRADYSYTLDLTEADPTRDGVEDFLFHLKRGHCEYFASAMTVMCQCLGVRARLVTGFAGGEYDSADQGYTIRQRDAHAWTEVYTRLTGWRTFDATPGARFEPEPTSTAGQWWGKLRDTWRDLEFAWFSNVVGYNDIDRGNLAAYVQKRLAGLVKTIKLTAGEVWRSLVELFAKGQFSMTVVWFFLALAAMAAIVVALTYLRRMIRPGKKRPVRPPTPPRPPAFVRQLLKLLARRGFKPTPDQTARQWAAQAIEQLQLPAKEVHELIDLYDRLRWSGRAVGRNELGQAELCVRCLPGDGQVRGISCPHPPGKPVS